MAQFCSTMIGISRVDPKLELRLQFGETLVVVYAAGLSQREVLYTKALHLQFEMSKFSVKVVSNDACIPTKRRCMIKNTSAAFLELGAIEGESQWSTEM